MGIFMCMYIYIVSMHIHAYVCLFIYILRACVDEDIICSRFWVSFPPDGHGTPLPPPVVWVGVGGGLNTIYYKEPFENQTRRRHKNPIQRGPAVAHQGAAHRQVLSCS